MSAFGLPFCMQCGVIANHPLAHFCYTCEERMKAEKLRQTILSVMQSESKNLAVDSQRREEPMDWMRY